MDLQTETLIKAVFAENQQTYGSRRMRSELAKRGLALGRYKVRKLLNAFNLKTCWKRKFVHTTDSKHTLPVAENLLNRKFNPEALNQAWTSDITYIRTRSGWLYLAVVMDLCSRRVIGWAMESHMRAELVCQALIMAQGQRNPAEGVLLHSDRGSQYASEEYQALLKAQDGVQHEPERKLLGQRADGALLPEFEDGAGMAQRLRQPGRSPPGCGRLPADVLQPETPELGAGQYEPGRV